MSVLRKKEALFWTFVIIVALGGIVRLAACFWGYPYQLHPDEGTIVNSAITMLKNRSYEAGVYNRPDHFEIKCNALLFQAFSYLRYGMRASDAFDAHRMTFYLIARFFTAVWGTLMIPLAWKITEKIKQGAGLIAAFLVAFFPIFVRHSAYATPDIVLTFWVMLVAYLSILYLETPSVKTLAFICMSVGVGITIKYTAAISCLWIAIIATMDCLKRKRYLDILKLACLCIFVILATSFLIAPNLYTNLEQTIKTLKSEARSVHLGADGLGFFGNMGYYVRTFFNASGYECLIPFGIGAYACVRKKLRASATLLLGALFFVCTSYLALHWERWGMPVYAFAIITVALGLSFLFDSLKEAAWERKKAVEAGFYLLSALIGLNFFFSSCLTVQEALTPEARVDAIDFCAEQGITKSNCLYDGYTPFRLFSPANVEKQIGADGALEPSPLIQYYILSSSMYDRYYAEPKRYQSVVANYDAIQTQCDLIYEEGGSYYAHSGWAVINVFDSIAGLLAHNSDTITGAVIKAYKIPDALINVSYYELGETILFYGGEENASPFLSRGFSGVESWARWTNGHEAEMRLQTSSNAEKLYAAIDCGVYNRSQTVRILVNDECVYDDAYAGDGLRFSFTNPGENAQITILFELPDAVSPASLGSSRDSRTLGLSLKSMVISDDPSVIN